MHDFKIPSKTFVLGEYTVLSEGKAIVFTHTPYFEFIRAAQGLNRHTSHPIFKQLSSKQKSFTMVDPHEGRGGFGASSALLLGYGHIASPFQLDHAFALHKKYHSSGSGADLISQYHGGLRLIDTSSLTAKKLTFPADVRVLIFRTGIKTQTHIHLAKRPVFDASALAEIVNLWPVDRDITKTELCKLINQYEDLLLTFGLRCDEVKPLIEWTRTQPLVLAAKGCGALGSDVILAVCAQHDAEEVTQILSNKLTLIATDLDLAEGMS